MSNQTTFYTISKSQGVERVYFVSPGATRAQYGDLSDNVRKNIENGKWEKTTGAQIDRIAKANHEANLVQIAEEANRREEEKAERAANRLENQALLKAACTLPRFEYPSKPERVASTLQNEGESWEDAEERREKERSEYSAAIDAYNAEVAKVSEAYRSFWASEERLEFDGTLADALADTTMMEFYVLTMPLSNTEFVVGRTDWEEQVGQATIIRTEDDFPIERLNYAFTTRIHFSRRVTGRQYRLSEAYNWDRIPGAECYSARIQLGREEVGIEFSYANEYDDEGTCTSTPRAEINMSSTRGTVTEIRHRLNLLERAMGLAAAWDLKPVVTTTKEERRNR